jgi:osmotically-inducible protein OsmY
MYCAKHFALIGVVGAMLIASGPAAPAYARQTTTKSSVVVDDSTLQTRVEANLKAQPTLKNQDIDVKVSGKVVTLTGEVQTPARKARAERAAHVAGVTSVANKLIVNPHAGTSVVDKTGDAAKTAAVKTGEAAKTVAVKTGDVATTVGSKTKEGAEATGGAITDAWIKTHIHTNMMNEPLLKASDVNVDVNNHMVTLKGTVTTAAGKARAAQIAKTTDGVKSVTNALVVGPRQ